MSNPKPVELFIIGFPKPLIATEFKAEKIMHRKEEIDHVRITLTMEELLKHKEKIDGARADYEEIERELQKLQ
jgi:hypothetical protein